jgi:protein ImuA
MADPTNRKRVVHDLSCLLRHWEQAGRQPTNGRGIVCTGLPALDGLLPDRGLPSGTIIEWLGVGSGHGATTLALKVAGNLLQGDSTCFVIDERREFYPPGVARRVGFLDKVIVVHPANARDALWALEQSLRCSGVTVVVGWIDKVDDHAYRRLQLAAEAGGGIGLLLRSASYRPQPSWAGIRVLVEPLPAFSDYTSSAYVAGRRLRVELVHCRGRICGEAVELEIDDETGDVRALPVLAAATDSLHAAGA